MGSSGINRVHGECCGHHTALTMNQICLVVALFGSVVLSEEVVRNPKLFFVSTSATTTTLQTASICYLSSGAASATCTGRKRRAITSFSEIETEVQPKQDEVDSSLQEAKVATGTEDSYFIGSPPPPSLPPPLTLSHIQFQAYCALHQGETTVDSL